MPQDTEYSSTMPENVPPTEEGTINTGVMSVAVKTEKGHTLTHEYGFTIEEEEGKVLSFDMLYHEDLGPTLLFGNQVFVLKFWDDADLQRGLDMFTAAVKMELARREGVSNG